MITVKEIREKFPNPKICPSPSYASYPDTEYCVGGALCMFLYSGPFNFPGVSTLSSAALKANPELKDMDRFMLREILAQMTEDNDTGDFEGAWRKLDLLLNWKRQ
jgi:hypothetical protein